MTSPERLSRSWSTIEAAMTFSLRRVRSGGRLASSRNLARPFGPRAQFRRRSCRKGEACSTLPSPSSRGSRSPNALFSSARSMSRDLVHAGRRTLLARDGRGTPRVRCSAAPRSPRSSRCWPTRWPPTFPRRSTPSPSATATQRRQDCRCGGQARVLLQPASDIPLPRVERARGARGVSASSPNSDGDSATRPGSAAARWPARTAQRPARSAGRAVVRARRLRGHGDGTWRMDARAW